MPVKLRLSAAARDDLRDIRIYSKAAFGVAVAREYMAGLRRLFVMLRERPLAGALIDGDRGDGIRSMTYRPHRLFYLADGDLILVIRILHHARDAARAIG